jgi:hypothetical protein
VQQSALPQQYPQPGFQYGQEQPSPGPYQQGFQQNYQQPTVGGLTNQMQNLHVNQVRYIWID